MTTLQYILSIDQGTTSSRAVVLDQQGQTCGQHQLEFKQYYPQDAWVEHDPEEIWQTVLACCRQAIANSKLKASDIAAIGISNQRETTIIWDRKTGKPIYSAIVWQDRRTSDYCEKLKESISNGAIQQKTGLLLDPYFSASKINWLLDHVPGARARAEKGELAFGTIDSFLIWRLTGGQRHVTCASNAARTLLFNIITQQWDDKLLALFSVPESLLPEVLDNAAAFGETDEALLGASIPISGVAGDQQAAMVGQACFQSGMIKSTYGTGCFMVLNTGSEVVYSSNRLLSTIGYRLKGKVTYALEGSIFVAGAAVQWLRDALHFVQHASDTQRLALEAGDNGGVYLVPAFTGLGAPYWDPSARGALLGLTRDTGIQHIVRAALEAVCYQSRDLLNAMTADFQGQLATLRVDGGMVANNWLLQFLSDMLGIPVERPECIESSAQGAAALAALGVGLVSSLEQLNQHWSLEQRFEPKMESAKRDRLYQGWQQAVERVVMEI